MHPRLDHRGDGGLTRLSAVQAELAQRGHRLRTAERGGERGAARVADRAVVEVERREARERAGVRRREERGEAAVAEGIVVQDEHAQQREPGGEEGVGCVVGDGVRPVVVVDTLLHYLPSASSYTMSVVRTHRTVFSKPPETTALMSTCQSSATRNVCAQCPLLFRVPLSLLFRYRYLSPSGIQ